MGGQAGHKPQLVPNGGGRHQNSAGGTSPSHSPLHPLLPFWLQQHRSVVVSEGPSRKCCSLKGSRRYREGERRKLPWWSPGQLCLCTAQSNLSNISDWISSKPTFPRPANTSDSTHPAARKQSMINHYRQRLTYIIGPKGTPWVTESSPLPLQVTPYHTWYTLINLHLKVALISLLLSGDY